jgi:hypothetical protein
VNRYVMNRSFAEHMGFQWPKDIACIIDGEPITFAQLKAEKISRQRLRLQRIRGSDVPTRQAAYVWTFEVEVDFPYGGWHLYIRSLRNSWWLHWEDDLAQNIMQMFPCGLAPIRENFYSWKIAFGKSMSRPGRFRNQGLLIGWIEFDGWGTRPSRFIPARESRT